MLQPLNGLDPNLLDNDNDDDLDCNCDYDCDNLESESQCFQECFWGLGRTGRFKVDNIMNTIDIRIDIKMLI